MAETEKNTNVLGEKLTKSGYIVYINDHRGHGESEKCLDDLGYLAESDGFDILVKDMKILTDIIKAENQGVPVYLWTEHCLIVHTEISIKMPMLILLNAIILSGLGGIWVCLKLATP